MAQPTLANPPERVKPSEIIFSQKNSVPFNSHFYRPELDVLRFFAFLSVFLSHGLPAFNLSHFSGRIVLLLRFDELIKESGGFGVCLFFCLSAYLITELLERECRQTGSIRARSFYLRRVLRIWPLYFSFLLFGVIFGIVFPAYRIETSRIFAFIFLSGNWYVVLNNVGSGPIVPLWSISVEEQFYLLWPWISKIGRKGMIRACLLLFPVAWLALFELANRNANANSIWTNSFVQFQFFGLGALFALGLRGRIPQLRMRWRLAFLPAGVILWLIAEGVFHIKGSGVHSCASLAAGYMSVAIGCMLIFFAFLGIQREYLPSKVIYLGKISYGLYVFHALAVECAWKTVASLNLHPTAALGIAIVGARLIFVQVLAMAMTILLAMGSYQYLERPFLKMKERFTTVKSRAA